MVAADSKDALVVFGGVYFLGEKVSGTHSHTLITHVGSTPSCDSRASGVSDATRDTTRHACDSSCGRFREREREVTNTESEYTGTVRTVRTVGSLVGSCVRCSSS